MGMSLRDAVRERMGVPTQRLSESALDAATVTVFPHVSDPNWRLRRFARLLAVERRALDWDVVATYDLPLSSSQVEVFARRYQGAERLPREVANGR